MKNVKDIQDLIRNAEAIKEALIKWDAIQKEPNCDKKGFGFNKDSRFAACDRIEVHIDSWSGYFGNSGCSNILHVDSVTFNKHLLKTLNKSWRTILEQVSESILGEAREMKDAARKELEERMKSIESL